MRIDHLGIAVEDLDAAVALHRQLYGAEVIARETLDSQGVDAALLVVGDTRIELLASLGPDTPVGKFLASRGPGMHHVAFEVADVAAELDRLRADGVELVDEQPRPGAFGHLVAFVHPRAAGGVLAELVEHERQ
jgi:methylmalonyl-CoA epimerase